MMMSSDTQHPALGTRHPRARRAFTLVELMVVVGIILLLVTLTVPAIGPMMASNEESQAVSTINGLLTAAQATAQATGVPVAVRFERAYKVNDRGIMVDLAGRDTTDPAFSGPVWLDHQRARILTFAAFKDVSFRHDPQSKVYSLPRGFWVAPSYAIVTGSDAPFASLAHSAVFWQTAGGSAVKPPVAYNRLETFFVVVGSNGELTRFTAGNNVYADQTQPYIDANNRVLPRYIDVSPKDDSARGVLLYDRKKWESLPAEDSGARLDFLRTSARVLFINRATAIVVEGAQS